jgi:hypothetical protein
MLNLSAVDFKNAAEYVLDEKGAKVPDMSRAVNRRATAVKTQRLVALGGEWLNGSAECVVELDGHL